MITLWILAILAVFAVSLGHRAAINLKLSRYQRDGLKAYYLAKAGINKAIAELERDQKLYIYGDHDDLNETWHSGLDAQGNSIFENVEIEKNAGNFSVKYLDDAEKDIYRCMRDEESRINLNTASAELLITLLKKRGIEDIAAEEIANYIRIWRGNTDPALNADADTYKNFKKKPFANPQEFMLVLEYFYQNKGEIDYPQKARQIYTEIKDFITVYPSGGDGKININTASAESLGILGLRAMDILKKNDPSLMISESDVATLVENILALRENNLYFDTIEISDLTKIKDKFNLAGIILGNIPDDNRVKIINALISTPVLLTAISKNFRIESTGNFGNINKKITAVYNRDEEKIVYWHEN